MEALPRLETLAWLLPPSRPRKVTENQGGHPLEPPAEGGAPLHSPGGGGLMALGCGLRLRAGRQGCPRYGGLDMRSAG